MVERSGIVDVARQAVEEAPLPQVQPALFPAAELDMLPDGPARVEALRKRGAGRPPGAINRRSVAFRDYVLRRGHGEHPLDGVIETYIRPVHDLARELGCTPYEAFKLQLDCRRIAAEYTEGKMPVSVNINGAGVIPVIFEGYAAQPGAVVEGEFFQEVSDIGAPEFDGGKFDGDR